MQFEVTDKTVGDLVELYRAEILKANPEYQRGIVWKELQKQKLVDSVLRGYPLPLIYLHYTSKTVAGMQNEGFEVIDGQQRIRSLYEFAEGAFKLLDPETDAKRAKFPAFIRNQACPWAGHDIYHSILSPEGALRSMRREYGLGGLRNSPRRRAFTRRADVAGKWSGCA